MFSTAIKSSHSNTIKIVLVSLICLNAKKRNTPFNSVGIMLSKIKFTSLHTIKRQFFLFISHSGEAIPGKILNANNQKKMDVLITAF